MGDASFIACAAQCLFGAYLGIVLFRGARSAARKRLARVFFLFAANFALVAASVPAPQHARDLLNYAAVPFGVGAVAELAAFALAYARVGEDAAAARRRRAAFALLGAVIVGLAATGFFLTATSALVAWPYLVLLLIGLGLIGVVVVSFGLSWRRGHAGGREYFLASLWLLGLVLPSLARVLSIPLGLAPFRLLRDVSFLAFQSALLTSYLDEGHEPMSLRDRIVSGSLVIVLGLAVAIGYLVLPLADAPATSSFLADHAGAARLLPTMLAAAAVVVVFAPRVFRKSVLGPLDELTVGLASVEAGRDARLPAERRDELGTVARSFNAMVGALSDGRAALAEKIGQLEKRQREIEELNEELRRQIAARSRQLADAVRDLAPAPQAIATGVVLDSRYRVEELIGAGGMGMVFGACRLRDDRALAVKVMIRGTPDDAVRFMREAEITATLHHPNLVAVVDVGMHRGAPYFVMERLTGGSLADLSDRFGDMPFVLPILEQIAVGLAALHAGGVLHRDLKPANVMLADTSERPTAKIGDFGIAHVGLTDAFAATADILGPTVDVAEAQPASVAGTLLYMAPELAEGPSAYTAASDVFSFGVLAWEVCSGKLPFSTPPVMRALEGRPLGEPDTPAPVVRRDLVELIERCVAGAPRDRPTIPELRELMSRACAGS